MRLLIVLFVVLTTAVSGLRAQTYDIPQRDIAKRDPFVIAEPESQRYYIVTTTRIDGHVGLEAYESPDMALWRRVGDVYCGNEGWMQHVDGQRDHWWAPDTYRYRGRYYTIVTMTSHEQGRINFCTLLEGGRRPTDPYRNVMKKGEPISLTPYGQQCLDGSLYVDAKGQPWLVYSLEWNGPDVRDRIGETWAVRLKRNLKGTRGEPIRLFRANEASWPTWSPGKPLVVDAPFLVSDPASGHLICLWSSFQNGVYCVGQAISPSGDIRGPWIHEPEPIYVNGGHEMVFRDLQGRLQMSLHHDNTDAHLRIVPIEIREGRVEPLTSQP